jgi:hypothetical protein
VSQLSAHLTIYRNDIDGLPQPPALRAARAPQYQPRRLPEPAVMPPTLEPPELGVGM